MHIYNGDCGCPGPCNPCQPVCQPCLIPGPPGPPGPAGPAGESSADTIVIRSTVTAAPGAFAEVRDVTGGPQHVLDFVIPQGLTGPPEPPVRMEQLGLPARPGQLALQVPLALRVQQGQPAPPALPVI